MQESRSAGSKTKQAQKEGDTSNQEQQRNSCPSADNFCQVQARHWTPSCVHYMSQALSKAEDVDGGIEVVLDEEGQRWASWGQVRDETWMGSDHNEEYRR